MKPRGDVTRNPEQGYQWPPKKDMCPPKKKKEEEKKRSAGVAPEVYLRECVYYARADVTKNPKYGHQSPENRTCVSQKH